MSALRDQLRRKIRENTQNQPDENDELLFDKIFQDLARASVDVGEHATLVANLLQEKVSGELTNDRNLLIEKVIKVVSSCPEQSYARAKITQVLVEKLWDSLQHPPLTYVGEKYQYRQPDGSHNNIMYPDLGKAGTPYARSVRPETQRPGAKPDPGLLFDLLMARGNSFEPNEAGISSVLFYHASIITHDVFNTNRKDQNISDTSSYLDLAPLYGSSQKDQDLVRAGVGGELKPDTFHDRRLLAFPPGVSVLLIMYNRFHNHAARTLKAINEGGRFTPPPSLDPDTAQKWQDEHLFQVARLVTNGLYVNISLHDYLRAIANVPSTDSSWTLDPRVAIDKMFSKNGVPRGIGNQVSCEFNLLYRFHSAISERDAQWTKEFYGYLFSGEDPHSISFPVFFKGIAAYESSIPVDPSQRTIAGLKRKPDGTFKDEDLVRILKESIEAPGGRFGANHVPDILKPVEILGIIQARKWNVASLNEFRKFFNLKPYQKFEDLNPDPYVAKTLANLYGDVDNVEMYPGMFLEATKPAMSPGMGLCGPYSVTRAVFSDAITLVRGDRFLTLDYTPASLTNWGITEVASDTETLGGAKMHHLILNAFPKYFQFNSVYAMQPFYTPQANRKTFEKLGTANLYSFDPPTAAPPLVPITSHAACWAILADNKNFRVPWGSKMASLETYMLAGDTPECAAQRKLVKGLIYGNTAALHNFALYSEETTLRLLRNKSSQLGRKSYQVDVVKNISNLAALYFAADMCYLPLNAPTGPSYTEDQLFKVMCDITTYVFSDSDPTRSWARRRESHAGTAKLCSDMETIVKLIPPEGSVHSQSEQVFGYMVPTELGKQIMRFLRRESSSTTVSTSSTKPNPLAKYGIVFARRLLDNGKSPQEVAEILVGTASAFVANTTTAFVQLIDFYLEESMASHWKVIQRLAAENTTEADQVLTKYVLEGFRLSNSLGLLRVAVPQGQETVSVTENGVDLKFKKGDNIFLNFGAICRDKNVFPEPEQIRLDRPIENYVTFGYGPHQCLGKDLNIIHSRTMLKIFARLPNLRRTPGDEGRLKFITQPGGLKIYLTEDWSKLSPYPTTMKLMWDGPP